MNLLKLYSIIVIIIMTAIFGMGIIYEDKDKRTKKTFVALFFMFLPILTYVVMK